MKMQTVTLNVPDMLYHRLQERAAQKQHSLEAEVLHVLIGAVPVADELPPDLTAALSPLRVLDDAALWQAASARLPAEVAAELEDLHLKQQRERLTDADRESLAGLVRQYERNMLVRAQAAVLLKERGHDVSPLVGPG
jgi:plasmid stability protein